MNFAIGDHKVLQYVMEAGERRNRRSRVPMKRTLRHGKAEGQTLDPIAVGTARDSIVARVSHQCFMSTGALARERAMQEGRFARPGYADEGYDFASRDLHVKAAQVVLARAHHPDGASERLLVTARTTLHGSNSKQSRSPV